VMRQTNRTAQRAFPWVFDLERSAFIELRDQIVDTFRSIKAAAAAGQPLRKLGLQLQFAGLLLRQFSQPMRRVEAGGVA